MAVQPILEKIQTWLNETYAGRGGYNAIAVTGEPGWDTTNAMLIAYQIENGVSVSTINTETSTGIYDFTSQGFSDLSASTDFSLQSNLNRLYILQGAFYVKGINPGGFQVPYNSSFSGAVNTLQSNAGIGATGIVDILVAKALLSMDDFIVLPQYGGVEEIAQIQRALNAKYAYDMGALLPCDGVYGRDLNKGLIYAFQITEGISPADANEADGHFGLGTQAAAPTLSPGDENYFVTILQYALYCNGYTNVSFTGIYDSETETAVANFGRSMGISTNFGAEVNLDVWMGLLLSSGNPNRSVSGCDTSENLSYVDAKVLVAKGYTIVGRYISGKYAMHPDEITNVLNAGLNIFPIYETGGYQPSYFSEDQGIADAIDAVERADSLGIPQYTRIYFTVDYDMEAYQIENLVIPYFKAIKGAFIEKGFIYNIGVYGSRNVCNQVIEAGYADLAFVDGASTGYSGNMGFNMPTKWAFNQIKEDVTIEGIQIDKDQVSGRDTGFGAINPIPKETFPNEVIDFTEKLTKEVLENIINVKSDNLGPLSYSSNRKWLIEPLVYARMTAGIKLQAGEGSFITYYRDKENGDNIDIESSGLGINITPILDNFLVKDFVESTLNIVTESFKTSLPILEPDLSKILSLEIYPKYPESIDIKDSLKGTLEGYYEVGAEVSFTLTTEILDKLIGYFGFEEISLLKDHLGGTYFYIDFILGFNDTKWSWFHYGKRHLLGLAMTIIMGWFMNQLLNENLKWGEQPELKPTNSAGQAFKNSFSSSNNLYESISKNIFNDKFEDPFIEIF